MMSKSTVPLAFTAVAAMKSVKSFQVAAMRPPIGISYEHRSTPVARNTLLAKKSNWNEEHLAHGASEVHEETPEELLESEEAAAWDAHDLSDAGMESAAEERAVMLAAELMQKLKEKTASGTTATSSATSTTRGKWNDEHLAHGVAEIHEETEEELFESEQAAAWDAHDVSDAGMESAAEERAVMLAAEMVQKLKRKSRKQEK